MQPPRGPACPARSRLRPRRPTSRGRLIRRTAATLRTLGRAGEPGIARRWLVQAGSSRRSREPRRRRSPAPRGGAPPGLRPLAGHEDRQRAAASGERCSISKSDTLIRYAPSAWKIPASTRDGRGGARAADGARPDPVGGLEHAAAVAARLADPAGEEPRRRRSASAYSSCSTRRRCSPSAAATASRFSRKMSTQIRGFAPAMRVMSRSEPPAAGSGSWPSTRDEPAWLRRTFASACGRWLVTATSRSCARRVDRDRPRAERGDERVHRAVALRPGRRERRQEPRRALEQVRAGRPGPRVSAPQIGCPPTNRGSSPAAAQTAPFVEPTSVTVQSSARAASTSATTPGSSATGTATSASSAPASASASDAAGLDCSSLDRERRGSPDPRPTRDVAACRRDARRAPPKRR